MIRLGIIGFGGVAHWHADSLPQDVVTITAVYDVNPDILREALDRGWKAYEDLEGFLMDEEIDVVLVSTPNNAHRYLTVMALRAGKHVICEKPVTMTPEDLEQMMAEAIKADRLFTIHQNRRWDDDYLTARKVVESGMVGRVISMESRVVGSNGIIHGWRGIKEYGGGMLYDWGVHLVDQLCQIYPDKKITSVCCRFGSIFNFDVEDYVKAVMTLDDGTILHFEVNMYAMEPMPRWYIVGDEGTCVIQNWGCEGSVTQSSALARSVPPVIVQTKAGPTRSMAPQPEETKKRLPLPKITSDGWQEYYRNVDAAVNKGDKLHVQPAEAMRVLRVLMACFESAKNNNCVNCEL